jgi:Flp pilus assembly protein TadD
MFRLPGAARAGTRLSAPVALVDVLPTVLELVGLPRADLEGRPLLGRPSDESRPIYSETQFTRLQYGWSELTSIILGDLQYIEAPRPELYDLAQDPLERSNLLPGSAVPREMRSALEEVGEGESSTVEIDEEELRQLASLGYVGSTSPSHGGAVLADPKDHIADVEELWALIRRERGTPPEEARVHELLATVAEGNESLHRASARSLLHHGRVRTAYEILSPFGDSVDAETCIVLGQAATTLGQFGDAHRHFERAVRLDPTHPEAEMGIGTLLLSEGRFSDALPRLERSVELDPRLADAWNGLGAARIRGGDPSGAIEAWRRATEIDPAFDDAWFNLALGYRQTGNREGAIEALRSYADLVDGEDRERALSMLRSLGAG